MTAPSPAARQRTSLQLHGTEAEFFLSPLRVVLMALAFLAAAVGGYVAYARVTNLNAEPDVATTSYIPAFRSDLSTTISTTGTVEATQEVDLAFGASGEIVEINVAVGDVVSAGQELARLDDTQLQASLRSAETSLASAQARLDAALNPSTADVASAEASVLNAQNQVSSAEQALSDLKAKPTSADLASAQQGVLSAQNSLQSAEDALLSAQNAVEQAEADLESAKDDLNDAWDNLRQARSNLNQAEGSCFNPPSTPSLPSKGERAESAPVVSSSFTCDDDAALAAYQSANNAYGSAASAYNSAVSNVNSRDSSLVSAESSLNSGNLERSIQSAQLGLATALSNQDETLAGATALEISEAEAQVASAKASLAVAQANYNELFSPPEEDVLSLQASVDSAADNVTAAEENLADAIITAPFDGTISALSASKGDTVGSAAIMTLVNPDLVSIVASVDQTDVPNLAVGQTATVTFDALTDYTYEAAVSSVGLVPTTTSGVVTYQVTFALDTSTLDADTPIPTPGMTATLDVTTSEASDALVVPSRSISGVGNFRTVMVKGEAGDEVRQVTTGISNGTLTEILSGIEEGEEVAYSSTTSSGATGGATEQQNPFEGGFPGGGAFPGGGGADGGGFPGGFGP